jgi:hypothetical protein
MASFDSEKITAMTKFSAGSGLPHDCSGVPRNTPDVMMFTKRI